ncbi:MAG: D-alanyl-D-alanine carboxypeptidase [Clostridia bacterium]|nr:D-alanyl-D-alanine carboxypeptidase [Clostridia bacterium]
MKTVKFFSLLLALFCFLPSILFPTSAVSVSAASAILYEPSTNLVLFEKDADQRRPMASTTKIITALVALDVLSKDEEIKVPKAAVGVEGTSTYLEEGEILTLENLLYALLLQSANDAAVAIAIACDGSVEKFAERMNALACRLDLKDTHFTNPHGLPDKDHYTTARELAILTAEALKNPLIKTIVSTEKKAFSSSHRSRVLTNHNKLLRLYDNAVGVKTGFTKTAGRCLVGAAEVGGMTLISVTLKAGDDWNDHISLFEEGFSTYHRNTVVRSGEIEWRLPVINGSVPFVDISNEMGYSVIEKRNSASYTVSLDIPALPVAPIERGDILGYLCIYKEDKEVERLPLKADFSVLTAFKPKRRLFSFFQ